jgi:hypothetical protein
MEESHLPYPAESQIQTIMAQLQQQPMVLSPGKEKKISRHKFTPEEDEILRNLVVQFGKSDWTAIAQHFQNRTPRQCRDRWKHYISPEVVTGNWTEADEQLLLDKVAEIGPKWSTITQLFPGRTDIGVKNHYISLTGRKSKEGKDKGPQRAVMLPVGQAQELCASLNIELPPPPAQPESSQMLPDIHHLLTDDKVDEQQDGQQGE